MGRQQNCGVLIDITGEITLTNRKRAKIVKAIPKRVEVLSKTGLQSSSVGNFATYSQEMANTYIDWSAFGNWRRRNGLYEIFDRFCACYRTGSTK
jgi:hypothetical protein